MSEIEEKIRFESRRVGTIEVSPADIMHFESLPGFSGKNRFVIVDHTESSPLAWLACLDDPDLAFVVTAPLGFFPDYDPPIDRDHLAALGIEKKSEVELLCIVTLAGKTINLNLAAPLLINSTTRRGLQVISDDSRYSTREPIPGLKDEATTPRDEAAAVADKLAQARTAAP